MKTLLFALLLFLSGYCSAQCTCQFAVNRLLNFGNQVNALYYQHQRTINQRIHPVYRGAYFQNLDRWYMAHMQVYYNEYQRIAQMCSCRQRRGDIARHETPRVEVPRQTQNKRIQIPTDPIGIRSFSIR